MKKLTLVLSLIVALGITARAQVGGPAVAVKTVATLPATCRANAQYTEIRELRGGTSADGVYRCKNDGTGWSGPFATASAAALAANTIPKSDGTGFVASSATDNGTTLAITTIVQAPTFKSSNADTADAGAIRLGNNENIAWEKATPGTDWTLGVSAADVLVTNAPFQVSSASFGLSGAVSGAGIFGTSGILYKNVAATLTDTTSSGTVAAHYTNLFPANTLAASSATTITEAFNTYFNDPVQGSNVTLTRKWALGADSIRISRPVAASSTNTEVARFDAFDGANRGLILYGIGTGASANVGIGKTTSADFSFFSSDGSTKLVTISQATPFLTVLGNAQLNGTVTLTTAITNAAGTPGSLCYNTATFEMTKNNALTCTVSSRKFKQNIQSLPRVFKGFGGGGDFGGGGSGGSWSPTSQAFDKLRPVRFAYNDHPERTRYGFIAEEAAQADSRFGDNYDANGKNPISIDQNAILAATVAEVQSLKARMIKLEADNVRLRHQLRRRR